MTIVLPIQQDTCKVCGMPYGSPSPELSAATRSYCTRCENLPQNVMAVLDLHAKQFAEKTEQVKDPATEVSASEE